MCILRFVLIALLSTNLYGCQTPPMSSTNDPQRQLTMADARIDLGMGYLALQYHSKALQNFYLAQQYARNYYRVYLSLAQAHSLLQQHNQASGYYLRALQLAPDNDAVLFHYAQHLCYQESYTAASPWFNSAIEKAKQVNMAEILNARAKCALNYQLTSLAKQDLTQAIIYQPDHLSSVYLLAKLEFEGDNYLQAKQRLLDFHRHFVGNHMTHELLRHIQLSANNQPNPDASLGSDSQRSSSAAYVP